MVASFSIPTEVVTKVLDHLGLVATHESASSLCKPRLGKGLKASVFAFRKLRYIGPLKAVSVLHDSCYNTFKIRCLS